MSMKQFRIGPGAASIILIAVILSMCVLGVLSLMNTNNDRNLSERSAAITEEIARLDASAEASLAKLDEAYIAYPDDLSTHLPQGMTMSDDQISWTESDSTDRVLFCTVRLDVQGNSRWTWTEHRLSTAFAGEEEWN